MFRWRPQDSVLGPLLFSIYTSPIFTIAQSHQVHQQQYADDTQFYLALLPSSYTHDISTLQSCLDSLHIWFCENGMALNASKSAVILFGTSDRLCLVSSLSMSLGQSLQFLIRSSYLVQHLIPTSQWNLIPKLYPVPAFITSAHLNRFVRPWMTAWLVLWKPACFNAS